jgi:hypothetical protein
MIKPVAIFVSIVSLTSALRAQVEIDRPLSLTGTAGQARVMGIDSIGDSQDAVNARAIQQNSLVYAPATGSTDAYAVTLEPAVAAYTTGMIVGFRANLDNTGACTIDVNGIGTRAIMKHFDSPLEGQDIRSGQMVTLMYDGTHFQMLSQTGQSGGGGCAGTYEVFIASGTWTRPACGSMAHVKCWGGGGSGGRSGSTSSMSTGGGGGGYAEALLHFSQLGQTVSVTVGAGGQYSTTSTGNDGGDSQFGTHLIAYGGGGANRGGRGPQPVFTCGGGGGGGTPINLSDSKNALYGGGSGGSGSCANGSSGSSIYGGGGGGYFNGNCSGSGCIYELPGGTSVYGGGGGFSRRLVNGDDGVAPGGGGGGTGTGQRSGNGGAGRCVVTTW